MNKTLLFELGSITLLFALGIALLTQGLPGGGLIGVAALLAIGSGCLHLVNARRTAKHEPLQSSLNAG